MAVHVQGYLQGCLNQLHAPRLSLQRCDDYVELNIIVTLNSPSSLDAESTHGLYISNPTVSDGPSPIVEITTPLWKLCLLFFKHPGQNFLLLPKNFVPSFTPTMYPSIVPLSKTLLATALFTIWWRMAFSPCVSRTCSVSLIVSIFGSIVLREKILINSSS